MTEKHRFCADFWKCSKKYPERSKISKIKNRNK
jgi:hypothetical protein